MQRGPEHTVLMRSLLLKTIDSNSSFPNYSAQYFTSGNNELKLRKLLFVNFSEFNLRNKSILMSEVVLILQTFNKNYVKLQTSCFISRYS